MALSRALAPPRKRSVAPLSRSPASLCQPPEEATFRAGHGWSVVDLTGLLPEWLAALSEFMRVSSLIERVEDSRNRQGPVLYRRGLSLTPDCSEGIIGEVQIFMPYERAVSVLSGCGRAGAILGAYLGGTVP